MCGIHKSKKKWRLHVPGIMFAHSSCSIQNTKNTPISEAQLHNLQDEKKSNAVILRNTTSDNTAFANANNTVTHFQSNTTWLHLYRVIAGPSQPPRSHDVKCNRTLAIRLFSPYLIIISSFGLGAVKAQRHEMWALDFGPCEGYVIRVLFACSLWTFRDISERCLGVFTRAMCGVCWVCCRWLCCCCCWWESVAEFCWRFLPLV